MSRTRKKKKNQKPTPNPSIETKNKFKNIEWMNIETDSTPTIKKPEQLKQKALAPFGQAGRVHTNTKVIKERPEGTFKLPPAKFDAVSSPSRTKSPMGMNKQRNSQGSTKSLQRSYRVESMDCIIGSLNLEGITNNYNTWNHLAVCKQMSSISFLNLNYQPST